MMPTLKVKTKSGHIQDITFEEILEIDGVKYLGPADPLGERVACLEGRVAAIENIFLKAEEDAASRLASEPLTQGA